MPDAARVALLPGEVRTWGEDDERPVLLTISLSIKQKDADEEAAAIKGYTRDAQTGTATLGDILKEQMSKE